MYLQDVMKHIITILRMINNVSPKGLSQKWSLCEVVVLVKEGEGGVCKPSIYT